ncbi:MAG: hypothetical protein EOM18_00650 [Clostridia bacterium]|nr:hypothetical protein [Clostridia bacterium]
MFNLDFVVDTSLTMEGVAPSVLLFQMNMDRYLQKRKETGAGDVVLPEIGYGLTLITDNGAEAVPFNGGNKDFTSDKKEFEEEFLKINLKGGNPNGARIDAGIEKSLEKMSGNDTDTYGMLVFSDTCPLMAGKTNFENETKGKNLIFAKLYMNMQEEDRNFSFVIPIKDIRGNEIQSLQMIDIGEWNVEKTDGDFEYFFQALEEALL